MGLDQYVEICAKKPIGEVDFAHPDERAEDTFKIFEKPEDKSEYKMDPQLGIPMRSFDMSSFKMPEYFAQWRKHPDLEGWMKLLYHSKGGTDKDFDHNNVELTLDDIIRLKIDVENDALPKTKGFFFGESTEEDKPQTLDFCERAILALESGKYLFYHSSW